MPVVIMMLFSFSLVSWSREGRTDSPPQTTKYRHSSNVIRGRRKERGASAWEQKGHGAYYVFVAREMRNSRQGKKGEFPMWNKHSLPRADKGEKGGGVMRGGGPFPRINWTFPPCGFQMDEVRDFPPRAPLPPLFLFWAD